MVSSLTYATTLSSAAAAGCVAAVVILFQLWRLWTSPLSKLPGTTLSKFTGLESDSHRRKLKRVQYINDLHKTYGPIVRVSPHEVSIAGLDSTQKVHKINSGFLKADFYTAFQLKPIPSVFSAQDPAVHQKWRRLLAPTMSESSIKTMDEFVTDKIVLLRAQMQKERKLQGYVDVFKWMYFFANDVVCDMAFGSSLHMLETGKHNQYTNDLKRVGFYNLKRLAWFGGPLYAVRRLPILDLDKLCDLRDRVLGYAEESVGRYCAYMAKNPDDKRPMFFSRLLGLKGSDAGLTLESAAVQGVGFLVAGSDTTAITSTFIIYQLLKHPEVKAKLQAAISNLPERPTNEQLRAIPYLQHVIEETLRLNGAAPASLPRIVPNGGTTLDGYYIPAGYTVSPVAYALHRDPKIFGPDPEVWRPERWEERTEEMTHALHAFGGGSRACLGINLARFELRTLTVAFLRTFPEAELAFGVDGFSENDMDVFEAFTLKLRGERCLVR